MIEADSKINRTIVPTLLIVDAAAIMLCLIAAFYSRVWLGSVLALVPLGHDLDTYLSKWWIWVVIILAVAYKGGYGSLVSFWDEAVTFTKGLAFSFLVVWLVLSLQKESETVSRIVVTLSFIFMVLVMPTERLMLKFLLFRCLGLRNRAYLYERRKGPRKDDLRDTLNREWYSGYYIVGNIDMDSLAVPAEACFIPIECADEATIRALKPKVRTLIIVSALSGLAFMNTDIKTFLGKNITLITTSNGLLSLQNVLLKRAFDIASAGVLLLLLSPLLVALPVLIRIHSRGPAIFRHKRCGYRLEEFDMLKYRTMRIDGDQVLSTYLKEHPEALKSLQERNKIKGDPRVTGLGRLLRRLSLDELPQLYNVLVGDMSLVGPRPDSKDALKDYIDDYSQIYASLRPGVTGLWQVSGRSEIGYRERVQLDHLYMLNWSLWLDLVIMLKTFRAILGQKGAY